MSSAESSMPGGHPSTTQPIAGPCDSPKVVTVKSVPRVLPDMECSLLDQNRAQATHQAADAFGHRILLQCAVGNAEVAAVGHPEREARKHRHAVFPDQALGDRHRIH